MQEHDPFNPPPGPFDNGAEMESVVVTRIRERLTALDVSATGAEMKDALRKFGINWGAINDILIGKSKNPSAKTLLQIAKALRCDIEYLLGEQDHPHIKSPIETLIGIRIIGIVEAGTFRRKSQDLDERFSPVIHAPPSKNYPNNKHFALRIADRGMDLAKPPILEGMHVVCVDVVDANIELESGKLYAVERTLDGGKTYETTVKRAHIFQDRTELRPESSDKRIDMIVIRNDADNDPNTVVIGLVSASHNSYE